MWEIPEIPEFNDPDNFTEMVTRDYLIEAPWQELAENGVDAAHFRYVHHTEEVPELESYEIDGPAHQDALRSRSSPPRVASWTAGSTPTRTGPASASIQLLRDRRHGADGLQHADRRDALPHALQLHRAQAGRRRRAELHRRPGVRGRDPQAGPGGQADLGEQGAPGPPGAGRHRRPVHEVPQVGQRSSTPRASTTRRWSTSPRTASRPSRSRRRPASTARIPSSRPTPEASHHTASTAIRSAPTAALRRVQQASVSSLLARRNGPPADRAAPRVGGVGAGDLGRARRRARCCGGWYCGGGGRADRTGPVTPAAPGGGTG